MRGTIIKETLKSGSVRWGYHIGKGVRPDGKRNQEKKIRWETKREAVNALQKRIVELETPAEVKSDLTFREFYERWAEGDEGYGHAHWAPSTRKSNRQYIAYAFRAFGDIKLVDLTPQIIQTALYKLHKSGGVNGGPLSPKTLQEMMTLTSQCLTQARKWKLISENPCEDVKRISPEVREVKAVTTDEYSAILERTAETRYGALIAFCAAVAVRRGEALAVQWADINWDTCQIKISKSLSDTPDEDTGKKKLTVVSTKGKRTRNISLSKQTLTLLAEHKQVINLEREMFGPDYQNNDLVFPQADGSYQQPKQVSKRVAEFMQKAGVKASLHSMRHMHASILLQNRTPVKIVSERLGHADVMITLRTYAHTMPGDDAAAADTWDSATETAAKKVAKK